MLYCEAGWFWAHTTTPIDLTLWRVRRDDDAAGWGGEAFYTRGRMEELRGVVVDSLVCCSVVARTGRDEAIDRLASANSGLEVSRKLEEERWPRGRRQRTHPLRAECMECFRSDPVPFRRP